MFVQPLLLALKCISHAKYEKNLLIMPVLLLFLHNIRPNLPQILSKDHTHFVFFAGFQWNMLGDSINTNNFNCNPVVLKFFLLKPLKIAIFGPNLCKKRGQYGPHPKQTIFFFSEMTKADHKLCKTFHFIKISYVLAELWIFFYFVVMFFC